MSRHHFVCFGAPNPIMNLCCKTNMVKESLKVSWTCFDYRKLKLPLFCWKPLTTNNLGNATKNTHPISFWSFAWRQICMVQFNFLGILAISLAHGQTSTWRLAERTGRPVHGGQRLQRGPPPVFGGIAFFVKNKIGKMDKKVYLGWTALQDFEPSTCLLSYRYLYPLGWLPVLWQNTWQTFNMGVFFSVGCLITFFWTPWKSGSQHKFWRRGCIWMGFLSSPHWLWWNQPSTKRWPSSWPPCFSASKKAAKMRCHWKGFQVSPVTVLISKHLKIITVKEHWELSSKMMYSYSTYSK